MGDEYLEGAGLQGFSLLKNIPGVGTLTPIELHKQWRTLA